MFRQILGYTGTVIGDIKRLLSGAFNLTWYLLSKDKVTVSLSQFNTASPETRPGKECLYEATIANNTASSLWVRLLFDIYLSSNPVHPEGHYAYYEKRIFVQAHEDQRVKITYDWNDQAIFEIDGIQFHPGNAWRGSCSSKDKYLINAVLLDEDGNTYEKLTLVQGLLQ
jgi:hypothetical protein